MKSILRISICMLALCLTLAVMSPALAQDQGDASHAAETHAADAGPGKAHSTGIALLLTGMIALIAVGAVVIRRLD